MEFLLATVFACFLVPVHSARLLAAHALHRRSQPSQADFQQVLYHLKQDIAGRQNTGSSDAETTASRPRVVSNCYGTITEPGFYEITGSTDPLGLGCTTTIQSPPSMTVKAVIEQASYNCDGSHGVQLLDGMEVLFSSSSVPYNMETSSSRKWMHCPAEETGATHVKFSQNVAQFKYRLRAADRLVIRVEFVDSQPRCNVFINAQKLMGSVLYNISTSIAEDCAWYVLGPAQLDITSVNLVENNNDEECDNYAKNRFDILADRSRWNPREAQIITTICAGGAPKSVKLNCGKILLNLHSESTAEQEVLVRIRPLDATEISAQELLCE